MWPLPLPPSAPLFKRKKKKNSHGQSSACAAQISPERLSSPPLGGIGSAHISHFTTKRLKSRKQSVIGVVAIMFTKTLKKAQATTRKSTNTHTHTIHTRTYVLSRTSTRIEQPKQTQPFLNLELKRESCAATAATTTASRNVNAICHQGYDSDMPCSCVNNCLGS